MDIFFEILYRCSGFFNILACIALFAKTIMVWSRQGLNLPAIVLSLFRLYSKTELTLNAGSINRYRKIHNIINYYLYSWIFVNILIIIVFGKL